MQTVPNETKIRQLPGIRVTRAERQALEREAERLGVTLSQYTREALRTYAMLTRGGLMYADQLREG